MYFPKDGDDPRLGPFLHSVVENENVNASAHDKVIFTLASAALALSLTFSKDLAPFASARHLWVLLLSWAGFVATLAANIGGFVLSLMQARERKEMAYDVWRFKKRELDEMSERMQSDEKVLYALNVGQGIAFLASMLLMALYVADNVLHVPHAEAAEQTQQQQPPAPQGSASGSHLFHGWL